MMREEGGGGENYVLDKTRGFECKWILILSFIAIFFSFCMFASYKSFL